MSLAQPDCTARPITFTRCRLYFSWSWLKAGISPTQGTHQVAQKSSTTMLPSKSADLVLLPRKSGSENAGATCGCRTVLASSCAVGRAAFAETSTEPRTEHTNTRPTRILKITLIMIRSQQVVRAPLSSESRHRRLARQKNLV